MRRLDGVDVVALALALGLLVVVLAIVVGAIVNITEPLSGTKSTATLGENITQVLTATVGGVVGVLGSYVGYRAGHIARSEDAEDQ